MVINHAKPGDAGSEKCPELKEARKRANIRSGTIRRARIMPRQNALFPSLYLEASLSFSHSISLSLIPFPPRHSIFSVEQIVLATLPDDSFPWTPLHSLIFRVLRLALPATARSILPRPRSSPHCSLNGTKILQPIGNTNSQTHALIMRTS